MHTLASKLRILLLVVVVFATGFVAGNLTTITTAIGDVDTAFEPFWEVYDAIQAHYVDTDELDVPDLVNGAIEGLVGALDDQYSQYLTPENYQMFNSDISGDVEGIGVVIRTIEESGEIEVTNVLEGAPARAAGVLPGDIFYEVDGVPVEGLDQTQLAMRVRGPSGTTVNIVFKRGEEFVEFNIVRARFEVPNVESRILDNNIAYIRLNEFNSRATEQLQRAINELEINSRAGMIFDLRGNPGGLLSTAIEVGSLFIEDGTLLYETFGDGREEIFNVNQQLYAGINVPVVVLVDEGSASASELVAGAIKDRGMATLIGETTFGKGTVQTIQPLSNGGALRLTIARYLLPSRRWVHEVGVQPDIDVIWNPETAEEFNSEIDPQIEAAVNFLLGVE